MTNKTSIGPAVAALATIVAVAGGGAYLLANPTSGSRTTTPSQEVVVNRVNRLSSGEATYYSATTKETEKFTFTVDNLTNYDYTAIAPHYNITYSDGVNANYQFVSSNRVTIYSFDKDGKLLDSTPATYKVDGRNVVITSETGSVTT